MSYHSSEKQTPEVSNAKVTENTAIHHQAMQQKSVEFVHVTKTKHHHKN